MYYYGELMTETPSPNVTTTENPPENFEAKYLIVPLSVVFVVMLLSILVYCMVKQRRRIKVRQIILSLYDFDSNEDEWEPLNSQDNPNYSEESTTNL